jgi:hypothetical protein
MGSGRQWCQSCSYQLSVTAGPIFQGNFRPPHLDYYIVEFTFRFNSRTWRSHGKLFYRLMQQAIAVEPATGRQIKGKTPGQ